MLPTVHKRFLGVAMAAFAGLLAAAPAHAASAPKIRSAYTVDADRDGHVDGVALSWSKRVRGGFDWKAPFAFSIEQDGQPVTLTSMVVEFDPAARPPIVFHFRHKLVFAANATSVVRVRHKAPTRSGDLSDLGALVRLQQFSWRYVLRTGATWKGAIGRLVLAMPLGGTCDHEAGWRALGAWGGYRVLERVAFEPKPADDISCRWYRNEDTPSGWGARWFAADIRSPSVPWKRARRTPADVRGISASSQITRRADVYTEDGAVTDASNTAEAAFDGLLETAWSGYRLVIKATAKGKKWQDTSIAEVDFATGDEAWLEGLRQDPFFAPFFADGAPYLQPWASKPPSQVN